MHTTLFDTPQEEGDNDEKKDLVLIHGYGTIYIFKIFYIIILHKGGSGLIYVNVLKDLCKHYRVWNLDLVGMGLSSRPEYNPAQNND